MVNIYKPDPLPLFFLFFMYTLKKPIPLINKQTAATPHKPFCGISVCNAAAIIKQIPAAVSRIAVTSVHLTSFIFQASISPAHGARSLHIIHGFCAYFKVENPLFQSSLPRA